jgi:hypothetical protein
MINFKDDVFAHEKLLSGLEPKTISAEVLNKNKFLI